MAEIPALLSWIVEFVCVFILIMVILSAAEAVSVGPMAIGFTVAALIYFAARISGGHLNYWVTLVKYLDGKMSGYNAVGYVIAQGLGACLSLWVFNKYIKDMMPPIQCVIPRAIA